MKFIGWDFSGFWNCFPWLKKWLPAILDPRGNKSIRHWDQKSLCRTTVVQKTQNIGYEFLHVSIYDPGSRFATTPPPPPHGMVPKPAFCSIPHENVVFAVFFAWWVAGAVRKPANSLDFCNQPSENVLFAMFWLRHGGVVQPRPLLFLCQIVI